MFRIRRERICMMGFLEFMGPNKKEDMGTLDTETPCLKKTITGAGLAKFVVALALFAGLCALIMRSDSRGFLFLALAVYLVMAYFFVPRPNTADLGLLGGLVDHPLKYTDDVNRALLFLKIVLAPGRFIIRSLVDGFVGIVLWIKKREEAKRLP